MKSTFFWGALVSFPVWINGQTIKTIELNYNISDFDVCNDGETLYITPNSQPYCFMPDTTAPALPFLDVKVYVDNSMEFSTFNYLTSEMLYKENINLPHNSLPIFFSDSSYTFPIVHTPFTESSYPLQTVKYMGTSVMGNSKILSFLVCPFRYDTTSRKLYLNSEIKMDIALTKTLLHKSGYNGSNRIKDQIKAIVINEHEVDLTPSGFNERVHVLNNEPNYEYLIITCDSLKNEFQRLADWKTIKGIRTKVISVEDIYTNTNGDRPQLKIKQFIRNYYNNSNDTLQYVLLAGDHEIVPSEHCHVLNYYYEKVNGNLVLTLMEKDVACDLYYASLKDVNWDKNGNGLIGEVSDSIDFSNDIIVTRLSVNSVNDAKCQVDRILRYEQAPKTYGWEDNIILCGTTITDSIYNYNGTWMSDTQYKNETFLYPNYIRNNWLNGTKYMFYDTKTSFDGDTLYQFNRRNFISQFSKGFHFVHMYTHGDFDRWKLKWRSDGPSDPAQFYTTSHAQGQTNSGFSVIVTSACSTNGYSTLDTCLSEALMRNPNSGTIAYYGCSDASWYSWSPYAEGPSPQFSGLFFRALFTNKYHQIGRAVYESKAQKISSSMWNGSDRWLMYGMNVLCDAEMSVYLSIPRVFDSVNINKQGNNLTIDTGVQDCKICVTSKEDNGTEYFAVVDSVTSHTFSVDAETYNVCISKQGYIPYLAAIGDSLFIQNENIEKETSVYASHVDIGKDVTDTKSEGPVTISKGHTKIMSKNGVKIKNCFEVKPGAKFEIRKWQ